MSNNNTNQRRFIWFNQSEPSNKSDIWLSYNRRNPTNDELEQDDTIESVIDAHTQRHCDLILKAWDCGQWIPIVGFNTTAANKIDTVTGVDYTIDGVTHSGKNVYHPAIFTAESPNELYDAGTLGELLANTNFVTESEWQNLFDTEQFQNAFNSYIIGGDDYSWSTLINGNIDFATTSQCGGIYSATHPAVSSAFKPIEVKFYPEVQGYYQNEQHRLCVSASDVIEQINDYYNDNPGGSTLPIDPNQLTIVLENLLKNTSSIGWSILHTSSNPTISPEIYGINNALAGKYLRIKDPFPEVPASGWTEANCAVEWVDLPEQQEYSILSSSDHNNGPYVINGCKESSAANFFLNGEGGWTELIEGNGFNTFVVLNKIYIGAYTCVIQANDFTLDTGVLINVNGSYSNNHYPLTSFVDYLVEYQNGISRIKIESDNQVYLPYPSYMHFETSENCTFTFPKTMEFIETKSVNSLSGEDYYYTDADYYIIELKAETKYNVTFYKNCIKFETNSNSIFEQQLANET